jgi:hypothetical protein
MQYSLVESDVSSRLVCVACHGIAQTCLAVFGSVWQWMFSFARATTFSRSITTESLFACSRPITPSACFCGVKSRDACPCAWADGEHVKAQAP